MMPIEEPSSPSSESSEKKCAMCGLPRSTNGNLLKCARCKSVRYCSVEHQKAHWKSHKQVCQEAARRPNKPDRMRREPNLGWSALLAASHGGHLPVVTMLLDNGANIEARDNNGWTALMIAAKGGHIDVVSFLVERKANVHWRDYNTGQTALMIAAAQGCTVVVSTLLAGGANVHDKDKWGVKAAMHASQAGHSEVVSILIDALRS